MLGERVLFDFFKEFVIAKLIYFPGEVTVE
jgi:hypothetical protein